MKNEYRRVLSVSSWSLHGNEAEMVDTSSSQRIPLTTDQCSRVHYAASGHSTLCQPSTPRLTRPHHSSPDIPA